MRVVVKDLIRKDTAITFDLGCMVRDSYGDSWRSEVTEFDFSGIRSVSPSFLSQAASPILLAFEDSEIGERVKFDAAPEGLDLVWKKVREAAAVRRTLQKRTH